MSEVRAGPRHDLPTAHAWVGIIGQAGGGGTSWAGIQQVRCSFAGRDENNRHKQTRSAMGR